MTAPVRTLRALTLGFATTAMLLHASAAFAAPDEDVLGRSKGYPIGDHMDWFRGNEATRVGSFSHMDQVLRTRVVGKAAVPSPLPRAESPTSLQYWHEGQMRSIDDFLARQRITGLMVLRDGVVIAERYQYDRQPTDRFLSNSMSKSITSLAIGLAHQEGRIASLDDPASRYVPALKGSAYGETSIRHLLRMSSGVTFLENYGDQDDLKRMGEIWWMGGGLVKALRLFDARDAEPGARFHYASSETAVLGLVVAGATGATLSDFVSRTLWQPMGAEADAKWNIDREGVEMAAGNFNAVLRDYARLGVLLANDGMMDGRQILPKDYLLDATDQNRQPDTLAPGRASPHFGYGYQFWVLPGERRTFALLGIHGQAIYVDPSLKLVMVQTAAARHALVSEESLGEESFLLWRGLQDHFASSTAR